MRSPGIQTLIAQKAIKNLSEKIGVNIHASKIRYNLKNTLVIKDLVIPDQQADTLLFVKRLEAKLKNIDLNSRNIELDKISIKSALSYIHQTNKNTYNFSFILDSLINTKSQKKWALSCEKIYLNNHTYFFIGPNKTYKLANLYLQADSLHADSTIFSLNLNNFSTEINNKPGIKNASVKIYKSGNKFSAINLQVQLQQTRINIPDSKIVLGSGKTAHKLAYYSSVAHSKIYMSDLWFVNPNFEKSTDQLAISCNINGNNKNISLNNIELHTGKTTSFTGNVNLFNLKNKKQFTYELAINKLITNKADAYHISSFYLKQDTTVLPKQIEMLGKMSYTGKINGTAKNISANGVILTQIGKLKSFVKINNDSADFYNISADLQAGPVFLNRITQNNKLDKAFAHLTTTGTYSKEKGPDLQLDGTLQKLTYAYQHIDSVTINGKLTKEKFLGRIASFDPKIRFDFNGLLRLDTLPVFDFELFLYAADLHKLKIDDSPGSNLSFNLKAQFTGNNINNSTGDVFISNFFLFRDSSYLATDSISFTSHFVNNKKELVFYSEFLEGKLRGKYNTLTLKNDIEAFLYNFTPSLYKNKEQVSKVNNFDFQLVANYPQPVTETLLPGLRIAAGSNIKGSFNPQKKQIILNGNTDYIKYHNQTLTDLNLKIFTRSDELRINLDSKSLNYTEKNSLKNYMLSARVKNDSINLNNNWNNWLDKTYSGNLNNLITLHREKTNHLGYKIDFFASNINVLDTIWYIDKGFIKKDSAGLTVNNLKISNGNSYFSANGKISKNLADSVEIKLKNISTEHLNVLINKDQLKFQGSVTGTAQIINLLDDPQIKAHIGIHAFGVNGQTLGNLNLVSDWNKNKQIIELSGANILGEKQTLTFNGFVSPKNKYLDIKTQIDQQELTVLKPYLEPSFDNLGGTITGKLRIFGDLINPSWEGAIWGENAHLRITSTQVNYRFSDSVYFTDHDIFFENISVYDKDNNTATLSGMIHQDQFKIFSTNLEIESDRILGLDMRVTDNPLFYGTVYGKGLINIKGPTKQTQINIVATTLDDSYFYIPLEGKGDIKDNEFIEFISFNRNQNENKNTANSESDDNYRAPETVLNADITITPEAEIQIIFDPRIGDALKSNGTARLNMESVGDDFSMYGEYRINRGDFVFTLQNVINKRLAIEPGSTVSFSGHPLDAEINVDAVYKIRKASVEDLTQDETDRDKKIEVDCHLLMTDKLINPSINFAIDVPSATNDEAIDQLNNLPTEDLNKQVLSLLLVNKFIPLNPNTSAIPGNTGGLGATTASEMLSNQLSNWLSQVTSSFDLGFTYRPGDEYTAQEYELALTTKLWDDRIILNGNVGYSDQQTQISTINPNANPYTTDFQVEFKVNQKGNIRLRAFQKVNNDITYNIAPYTQGVGIFYTEEFDDFNELMQKMFHFGTAKKPDNTGIDNKQ